MANIDDSSNPEQSPIVAVIDADTRTRPILVSLFTQRGWRCDLFASSNDFLNHTRIDHFNCLILELVLPDTTGMELFHQLTQTAQQLVRYLPPVLFLSGHGTIADAVHLIQQGACDFLEKPPGRYQLLNAVEQALDLDSERRAVFLSVAPQLKNLAALTRREREVLSEILAGHLSRQIALRLKISPKTVEAHRLRICQKFKSRSSMELAATLHAIAWKRWFT